MKKIVLSIATLLAVNVMVKAQTTTVDFEQIVLDSSGYQNGKFKGPADFTTQGILFKNNYNYNYNAWTGFAFSNKKDVTSPGYPNQYSCYAGGGADSSTNFSLAYGNAQFNFDSVASLGSNYINTVRITNTTFAALDMKNGSPYSKKFGGATGNDPDYFYVKFTSTDTTNHDSVIYYLADFRFANNNDDYVVDNWKDVDLSPLNGASGVSGINISFGSSDIDSLYGYINTPTYVCIDNVKYDHNATPNSIAKNTVYSGTNFYPNPASTIITTNAATTSIYNVVGTLIKTSTDGTITVSELASGCYVVKMTATSGVTTTQKLIKQ